jgi:hypothetical protein
MPVELKEGRIKIKRIILQEGNLGREMKTIEGIISPLTTHSQKSILGSSDSVSPLECQMKSYSRKVPI